MTEVEWEVVTVTEYDDLISATAEAASILSTTTVPASVEAPTTVISPAVQTAIANNSPEANVAAQSTTASPVTSQAAVQISTSAAQQPATTAMTTPAVASPEVTTAVVAAAPSQSQTATTTGQYSGDATFYELGLTACGQTYTDSDYVAAISYKLFDINGTPNPNSKF